LAVSGSTVYMGGSFSGANSINGTLTRNHVAAADATTGTATTWNPNTSGEVSALAVSGSTVYMGGSFSGANSIGGSLTRNNVAAVDATTGTATAWDPNASGVVHALAVLGSTVYIGGDFAGANSINGTLTRNRLAQVDGTTGLATGWGPDADDSVRALASDSGGGVIAGGEFDQVGSVFHEGVASFSEPPAGTAAPAISGTPAVGQTLSCSQGAWSGTMPQSYAHQWLRDGVAIGGATATGYTVTSADAGHALSCRVTASNLGGGASATSAPVDVPAANPTTFLLSVSKAGAGGGSVTSSPGGINCGATCSASYGDGTNVILTATAAAGSKFDGWSGDCAGTGGCTVAMSAARSVTATFAKITIDKKAALAKSTFTATKGGVVTLPIGNPNGVSAQGDVALTTQVRVGTQHKKKTVKIGHATFIVPANGVARVKVPLNKKGRALLKKSRKLKVTAKIVLKANGTSKTLTRTITIKAPKKP
jgi:hypothetical protein